MVKYAPLNMAETLAGRLGKKLAFSKESDLHFLKGMDTLRTRGGKNNPGEKRFQRKLAISARVDCNQKFISASQFQIQDSRLRARPRSAMRGCVTARPRSSPVERPIHPWPQNLLDRPVLPSYKASMDQPGRLLPECVAWS